VQGQPSAHGCTMPSVGSESALHQRQRQGECSPPTTISGPRRVDRG
jgi:hypothetical protein